MVFVFNLTNVRESSNHPLQRDLWGQTESCRSLLEVLTCRLPNLPHICRLSVGFLHVSWPQQPHCCDYNPEEAFLGFYKLGIAGCYLPQQCRTLSDVSCFIIHKNSFQYLPSLSCMFALAPRCKRKAHSSTLLIWAAKIKGVAPSWQRDTNIREQQHRDLIMLSNVNTFFSLPHPGHPDWL